MKPVKVTSKKDLPGKATRNVIPKRNRTHRYYPTGGGWFAGSEAVVMGGYSGCMMLDFTNGNFRQSWFNLPELAGPCCIAGHAKQPVQSLVIPPPLYQVVRRNLLEVGVIAPATAPPDAETSTS